ncbi:MAG: DUF192 domain-containing protein [Acidimicrobiales bacterium]
MTASRRRWAWVLGALVVGLMLFAGLRLASSDDGASRSSPMVEGGFFDGFGRVSFSILPAGDTMTPAQRCALLAAEEAARQRGLMSARSLDGFAGMLFRFDQDTETGFFMKDTPMPLAIAWFDATGGFVGSTDMEPCLGQLSCPSYYAPRPFRFALEVPAGGLTELGAGPGSRLAVGAPGCHTPLESWGP